MTFITHVILEAVQRVAIIDLGSNSARLVAFAYTKDKHYQLIDELREIVRLSQGMKDTGYLQEDAFQRGLNTLKAFKAYCDAANISNIKATATSALREAKNGPEFLDIAQNEIGLKLELLPGNAEAELGVLAVANSVNLKDAIVIDIGGGSLQLSLMRNRKFVKGKSWPLGTVVTTEAFLQTDPIKAKDVKRLRKHVKTELKDWVRTLPKGLPVVGMGGTIRNLAKINKKANDYPFDILHNYVLDFVDLDKIVENLSSLPESEKRRIAGLNRDRADIITAGGIVVREALDLYGCKDIIISGNGLREGVFYSQLIPQKPHLIENLRDFSIQNLVTRYYDNKEHNTHVKTLSLKLFDELASLHGYGTWEKELLGYAAEIHDIGMAINYYDHHKHSFFLVLSAALPGFNHREHILIALLTRYHRKGTPNTQGFEKLLAEDDDKRILKLSALLRLAEYLERAKAQRITDLTCLIEEEQLTINVQSETDAYIELKEANDRKGLLETAYNIKVNINLESP